MNTALVTNPPWSAPGEHTGDMLGGVVATAGDVNGDGFDDVIVGARRYDSYRGRAYLYLGSAGSLSATAVWTITGAGGLDHLGWSVSTAGDVNGDGYDDVIVGAYAYDTSRGQVYVYHGSASGLSVSPDWTATGEKPYAMFGRDVSAAGDVNGDGYDDVIIGAPYDTWSGSDDDPGKVYVYYGSATGLSAAPAWTAGGENPGDYFGAAVGTAGDVNGDGYADIIVGASYNDENADSAGKVYVYHGHQAGLPSGGADWSVVGEQAESRLGFDVASAGDVNGDGYDDVVVGAYGYAGYQGRAYVYYGSDDGLTMLTADWTVTGEAGGHNFGMSVGTVGDIDSDGYDDVIVGAPYYNGQQGKAYVYRGSAAGLILDNSDWRGMGEAAGDRFGWDVGYAGDVDGDGYADIIVGAAGYDNFRGKAYVYHGPLPTLDADWVATGEGSLDYFAAANGAAGDVNGDGYSDVVVGAPGYDGEGKEDVGKAYLFLGNAAGLASAPVWAAVGEQAFDAFGAVVGAAGDLNGDGYADVVVGAPDYQNQTGKVYVYYGGASGFTTGGAAWSAAGLSPGDRFGAAVGTAGDVNGDGYADLVVGAEGYPRQDRYGKVYVYYGGPSGLISKTANWVMSGQSAGDRFGAAVGTVGDVNRDGFADLIVGAPYRQDQTGWAYIYHGSETGLSTAADWTAAGEAVMDQFAAAVGAAGDVNGDGYADVLVGAWGSDAGGEDAGRVYVYYGSASGLHAVAVLTITGESANDHLGAAVGMVGDADGDGYADVILGARGYAGGTGRVYVHRGSGSGLDAVAAFSATGEQTGDRFGADVGPAGDVDGDGYSDLLVGAYGYDAFDAAGVGRSYVYAGAASGLSSTPGWTTVGESPGDQVGAVVRTLGDVNGDGYSDVAIGGAGNAVDVYYGGGAGPLTATPGWSAAGESATDAFGQAFAAAGDVNGDGYADLIVGAPGYDGGMGRVYVYFGGVTGLGAEATWTATGSQPSDRFGGAVGTPGDVNGDGYSDLIVGAAGYGGDTGRVYIYYGGATGLPSTGAFDWMVTGEAPGDHFGDALGGAGDVNGDGYADVIIGAPDHDGADDGAGKVYLYIGGASHSSSVVSVWSATGEDAGDRLGMAVSTAGDVNGDGYADVVVGAGGAVAGRGAVYVFHGSTSGLDIPFSRFVGDDVDDQLGYAVGAAGDVDGDGYGDVLVGAPGYAGGTGRAYIYYGGASGLAARTLSGFAPGEFAGDALGAAVSTAGDVNGDGYADVLVGAGGFGGARGKVYLYLGGGGGGRSALARQLRGDDHGAPVQPWSAAYAFDRFQVALQTVNPLGRGMARLQVQACPPGLPFGAAACLERTGDVALDMSDGEGVLVGVVPGLAPSVLYRWRARLLYDAPYYIHGPWRRLMAQSMEADLRSVEPACDLVIQKTVTPTVPVTIGSAMTYTLEFYAAGAPALNVVITDTLPADFTDVQVTSSGVLITDTGALPAYVWRVQDLQPGDKGVITITGMANAARFINAAVITTTSPDVDPTNNRATAQTHIPGLLYVDQDATGAGDGSSWADAFTDLQLALDKASAGDEIWVAEGVYWPTGGLDRTATFSLVEGVALYGGFSGGEAWRHERDWVAYPTLLSGDIGAVNNRDDNVYHVVTAEGGDVVLDGFTIQGGYADGGGDDNRGGGMVIDGAAPLLRHVTFAGNVGVEGGGLVAVGRSALSLYSVAFTGNTALYGGGVMIAGSSVLTSVNVTFSRNHAYDAGGALYNAGQVAVTNGVLWGNTATVSGTQIYNTGSLTVTYSDVEGGWPGPGNVDLVPGFYDADGPDNVAGTLDDDLRLRHTSEIKDAGLNSVVPTDAWDLDGDEDTVEPSPFDLSGRSRLIGFTVVSPTVDMGAYEANILDVIAEADELRDTGTRFRLEELQLLPSETLTQAMQNYQSFNDGVMFYDFCADYGQLDGEGYCPEVADRENVRNILLDAIELYAVALDWPAPTWRAQDGREIRVRDVGGSGIVSTTHEIANVHLVFGNEFLIDAIDYRFSTAGIPNADAIIAQELDELALARRQFELTMDMLFRAFGADVWGVGSYFTADDFETFGVASSRMMVTLDEIAARYHMLGDTQAALDLYDQAYEEQYLQSTALAQMAENVGAGYLRNGSWEMLSNLSQLRTRAQAIRDGLDYFGFAPDYVPLQSYPQLLELTEGVAGSSGLWGTARNLEAQAREAQRVFDTNASDMSTELDNLVVELSDQLFELCGESADDDGDSFGDYVTCEGGLMDQNLIALDSAALQVGLAWQRAQNIVKQVQIEQDRASQVIRVNLGAGRYLAAADLAIGKLEAYQETQSEVDSSETQLHGGVIGSLEHYHQFEWKVSSAAGQSGIAYAGGFKAAVTAEVGRQWSETSMNSTEKTWNPNAEKIGEWNSLKALREAEASAEIEGANSAAVIRNLLLQQSEALLEYEIAMAEFNKLASEHNYLAQRRSYLLTKREEALNRVTNHNSHLLSPAYRIMRDTLTVQAAEAHVLASQFAYLTARAAEYDLLTPFPNLGDVYRARTSNDLRLFLDDLKVWYQALDRPGQLNRYPYTISIAKDVLGLTDENLAPDGVMSADKIKALRYRAFQAFLRDNLVDGRLLFRFGTSLDQQRADQQYLFSPNIWNNRIAGIGEPLVYNEGVGINIVTRQTGNVGIPEVILIHGGQSAYRNAAEEIVYYNPDTAVPVGYKIPDELDPQNTAVVLRAGVNGVGAVANSGLVNLSVSTSRWTLSISPDSWGGLDYRRIEDIEIALDSTGRALPNLELQASLDARDLQALSRFPLASSSPAAPPELVTPLPFTGEGRSGNRTDASAIDLLPLARQAPGTFSSVAGTEAITGTYYGSVIITRPLTAAVQILNVNLVNLGTVLTGTLDAAESALCDEDVLLHGVVDGDVFTLTTDVITNVVLGRTVQRQVTLVGRAEADGEMIRAAYMDVVTGLLPEPVVVEGKFRAVRPSLPGARRLFLEAAESTIPLGGSTLVTMTLVDTRLRPVVGTVPITLTADNGGTVDPALVDLVNGTGTVTLYGGSVPDLVTLMATTGAVTGSTHVDVQQLGPDVQIDKSAQLEDLTSVEGSASGYVVTYTLGFSNIGQETASGVVITDLVSSVLITPTFVAGGAVVTPRVGSKFVWDVADLAPGDAGVITVTAWISSSYVGTLFNTASISAEVEEVKLDNNVASVATLFDWRRSYLPLIMRVQEDEQPVP